MLIGAPFGRYEIRAKIGEGGMGEVYSARDAELDRDVAIKLLPSEFTSDQDRKSRFRQEARVVSSLNHPNIITIYEIGENEHGSFLATEFIEGLTLREVMKRESITLKRILRIIEQAANALVAAHNAKIVHRDIKPENIMVRSDAIVKVLDFGLAKPSASFNGGDSESNKTIPGTVMGSARYMSPEQARGLAVDERTDIWSLGVVLYEMLAGNTPFDGKTTADTIAAIIYVEPEPIANLNPDLPVELHRILRKALQKDRDERYQSVKDFALDIKDLLYILEHGNSGNKVGHTTSSPDSNENPTMMIHNTISTNHPTNRTAAIIPAVEESRANFFSKWRIAAGAVLLIALAGLGMYTWFQTDPQLAAAFEKPQISRITTDGKVLLPAISPDGKYVAYVSGEMGSRSLVVRQISTDSAVTVVPPTNLNFSTVSFSPEGDYVYYGQTRSDYSVTTLFKVPTLGGTPKKLIEDVDSSITFSPDGKQFAFIRHSTKTNEDRKHHCPRFRRFDR
jgi:serine/threonine protein kinase